MSSSSSLYCKGHAEHILNAINDQHKQQKLCDVWVKGKDSEVGIAAHRIILISMSDHFSDKISQLTGDQIQLNFDHIKHENLKTIIDFCYTGTLHYQDDTLEELLNTANLLKMRKVIEACCSELVMKLKADNCLELMSLAYKYNCEDLLEKSVAMGCKHFMELSETDEYLNLSIGEMMNLIESDDLVVTNEEFVFHKILQWINHDPIDRELHASKFMYCIRHPFLTTAFILEHIQPMCSATKDNLKLMGALEWHFLPDRRSALTWICTNSRKYLQNEIKKVISGKDESKDKKSIKKCEDTNTSGSESETVLVLGTAGSENAPMIEIYCAQSMKWFACKSRPEGIKNRIDYAATLMNENVIIAGGRSGGVILKTVHSLNLKTMKWTELPNMQTPRECFKIIVLSDSLYAVGGWDGRETFSSVERWDVGSNQWTYVAAMNTKRCNHGVVTLNDKIYSIGGWENNRQLSSIEYYHPTLNIWITKSPMRSQRTMPAMGVYNGQIYIFGGWGLATCERYDPVKDEWTEIASMSAPRFSLVCSFVNNNFMLVGKLSPYDGSTTIVEKYDLQTNKYIKMPRLLYLQSLVQALTIPNIIPEEELVK